MLFMLISRQNHTAESVAATWLLPIISAVVVSSGGAVVAHPLMPYDPQLARSTVIVAYGVWGLGALIALMMIALWVQRSALFGYPPKGAITAVLLPLGPCGQASFGIAIMGRVVHDLAYDHDTFFAPLMSTRANLHIADAIYAGGLVVALVIWGLGAAWYLLASAIIVDYQLQHGDFFHRSTFALNYWSLTFPIGVFATGATELASQLDSTALRVIGTILSLQVVLHWAWVSVMTVAKCWDGTLFMSPEVASMQSVPVRFHSVRSAAEKAQL
jgi:tellurite resistance protein TehA-like permease